MMTVPMDDPAPSAWELAERLYRKNVELENGLRKSAQSKVPSDPNAWLQMRENYEAIILEDSGFAEKHEVEYALWQLHYRRIEEFRAHINGATSAGGSITSQVGKSPARPDRIKKIRSMFKSFLSEATGFYHDLILKIRSKYGLSLGYITEAPEYQVIPEKCEKKSSQMKKGLISCHRCLIYLGDLSRYKGLYGEGDSVSRDYAAASSYYVQASSLWPSSGNPHHQLAILASYSCDELVAVYRYFRSLAADSPFSTARDNLIIAFEKNRQSYSQLPGNAKIPSAKILPTRMSGGGRGRGRGRGRGDSRLLANDTKTEVTLKEQELSIPEIFKAFSTRFVRLNGILFTRTSLETFGEIFSLVIGNLYELLSSGPEEELNFGQDAAENGLFILRLISILVFSVYNVNREVEGQSYTEILQRTVLLQNAFSFSFEFVGHILKRCIQLRDVASCYLLPSILVFMEWLACHPDIATRIDIDEKEATARSFFWNHCISFVNKLMLSGLVCIDDDEDTTCFSDMASYDEGETDNRLALWEDFELRGFSPLVPAQVILDFSRKHSLGSDGSNKEKKARMKRILAACKALMDVIRIDQQGVYYDSNQKKFVIGTKAPAYDDDVHTTLLDESKSDDIKQTSPLGKTGMAQSNKLYFEVPQSAAPSFVEGEEEDEVIVFQPTVAEKYPNSSVPRPIDYESIQPAHNSSDSDLTSYAGSVSASQNHLMISSSLDANSQLHTSLPSVSQTPGESISMNTSKWFMEQKSFINGLNNLNISENGFSAIPALHERSNGLQHIVSSPLFCSTSNLNHRTISSSQSNDEVVIPSKLDSIVPPGAIYDELAMKFSAPLPATSKKNPVSRPARHFGPPPGFSDAHSKRMEYSNSKSGVNGQHSRMDDYSWLDGYQTSSAKGIRMDDSSNHAAHVYPQFATGNTNTFADAMSFPFPGKQIPSIQTEATNVNLRQDFQFSEHLKLYSEQLPHANQQSAPLPEHYQVQSPWSSRYIV